MGSAWKGQDDPPARARLSVPDDRPPMAIRPVAGAMAVLAAVLTAGSFGYGYHRDELYFRMLDPAWGYLDQPPLTPLLVHTISRLVSDSVWAIRVPATVCAVASLWVLVQITRELGGNRLAQVLCAGSWACASATLLFGHVMLTASVDLLVWPLVLLLAIRAVRRDQPRWWWAVGLVVGLSTYNKLLIAGLLLVLLVGLLAVGPRRVLLDRQLLGGAALAVLIALPNLLYQAGHGWPQLSMGAALADSNADEVRVMMWPFLFLLLGPPLTVAWVAGLAALLRRPAWRPLRFVGVAFPALLLFTFLAGGQFYYPTGLLAVLLAVGCVPVAQFLESRPAAWTVVTAVAVVVNGGVSAVIGLPLLPASALGDSPVPAISQLAADQVGWPEYVRQTARVWDSLRPDDRAVAVLIATNYGEAGAVDRFGGSVGLPEVYSGHNALADRARPPDGATLAVIIGGQGERVETLFRTCAVVDRLDNGLGVDNEEQGEPITVCRDPSASWAEIWPRFAHLD